MKILITGGTGFLGKHLANKLKSLKYDVTAIGSKDCNLLDPLSLENFNNEKFDQIFHLAAWTQPGDWNIKHQGEAWIKNQLINTNVINWCCNFQPHSKIISIGTSCVFDEDYTYVEENYFKGLPRNELMSYGMTKRMLHSGKQSINNQYGIKYLTVVPSLLFGPNYDLNKKNLHFIFDLIKKIMNYKFKNEPIELWGNGEQKREIIFIHDFIKILLKINEKIDNDIVNISTGESYSIKEFAEMICLSLEVDSNIIKYNTNKFVGAKMKVLDNTKLKGILNDIKFININEAIEKTIKSFLI